MIYYNNNNNKNNNIIIKDIITFTIISQSVLLKKSGARINRKRPVILSHFSCYIFVLVFFLFFVFHVSFQTRTRMMKVAKLKKKILKVKKK